VLGTAVSPPAPWPGRLCPAPPQPFVAAPPTTAADADVIPAPRTNRSRPRHAAAVWGRPGSPLPAAASDTPS